MTASELSSLDAQLWLLSPSCQPYTVLNPEAKGAADPRAKSFIHLMEVVLPELVKMRQHPSHMLVENVAGFEVPCDDISCTFLSLMNTFRHPLHELTSYKHYEHLAIVRLRSCSRLYNLESRTLVFAIISSPSCYQQVNLGAQSASSITEYLPIRPNRKQPRSQSATILTLTRK